MTAQFSAATCIPVILSHECLVEQYWLLQPHHAMQSLCYFLATFLVVDPVLSFSPVVSLSSTARCDQALVGVGNGVEDWRGKLRRTSARRHVHVWAALKSGASHDAPAVSSTSLLKASVFDTTVASVSKEVLGEKELDSDRCVVLRDTTVQFVFDVTKWRIVQVCNNVIINT